MRVRIPPAVPLMILVLRPICDTVSETAQSIEERVRAAPLWARCWMTPPHLREEFAAKGLYEDSTSTSCDGIVDKQV